MDIFRLVVEDGYVHPAWLASCPRGRVQVEHKGVVLEGKRLALTGKTVAGELSSLAEGTLVEVWCNAQGFFVCATATDYDAQVETLKAQQEQKQLQRTQAESQYKEQAIAFNQALAIPVRWTPGHKDVLSGLSDTARGDGLNARSVVHVLLKEPLNTNRLHRNAGDLLCTATSGTNGKRWSNQREAPEFAKVTCQACLKLARRWHD